MVTWAKLKYMLEWARLAKFVFDIIVSIFSLKLTQKLLSYVPQVSKDWATIIAWLIAALVLFVLIEWRQNKPALQGQAPDSQNAPTRLMTAPIFDAAGYFATAYASPLQPEIENNVRAAAVANQPNNHEGFYVKLIASGLLNFTYDRIWTHIFKSQILMLTELNRRRLTIAEVKSFYDKAALEFPQIYAKYSFEQWMEFSKSRLLLIRHPSEMVEITVRGKDFLKYLVHCGYYADDKTF